MVTEKFLSLGETEDSVWKDTIRNLPAPWAELEAPGNLIFALPSSSITDLDNPTELMTFWNDVMLSANQFAGFQAVRFVLYIFLGETVKYIDLRVVLVQSAFPLISK